VGPDDVVVEIGAGDGALTRELASRARRLIAVEIDVRLASRLWRRFAEVESVSIVQGDALRVDWPDEPFRVLGNVPFGITTALSRRLFDEPTGMLARADLIVQREVAVKRTLVPPRNRLTLSWGPWWTFRRGRTLPRRVFHPQPNVDAALLTVARRTPPLLPPDCRSRYAGLVEQAFSRAGEPLPRSLRAVDSARAVRRELARLGLPSSARPLDLTTEQWVALFRAL
jgi:23S rRNA (adenine-N6)-dimethyltransferase